MTRDPIVSIGVPVYNGERYIRSALDSLLAQTFTDFEMIISDNASTDATYEICKEYEARDHRISLFRNDSNLGQIMNWRSVFDKSRGKYFMWGSEHDLWHPEFIEALVKALDDYPDLVLAYPLTVAIDAEGARLPIEPTKFDTTAKPFRLGRIKKTCARIVGAGNMMYGLFRAWAVRKCGGYPRFALPDRLLLTEMSVYGAYQVVDRELWSRRYPDPHVTRGRGVSEYFDARWRGFLFADARVPWYSQIPSLGVALGLIYHIAMRPQPGEPRRSRVGLLMAFWFLRHKRRLLKSEIGFFLKRLLRLSRGASRASRKPE